MAGNYNRGFFNRGKDNCCDISNFWQRVGKKGKREEKRGKLGREEKRGKIAIFFG